MSIKEETKAQRIRCLKKEAAGVSCEISVGDALEFRRDCYDLTATEFAEILGLGASHYSEIIHGKRRLPLSALKRAHRIGVPVSVLLAP